MIRLPALCLAGCVVCASLSLSNDSASFGARLPPAKRDPAAPEIRKLADPLFSPTQPHPEVPSSAEDADSLRDVRLTGVVIGPDLRVAIFAVTGTNPLMLSEGGTLKGWRLDSIFPEKVLLSGPAGIIKLEPRPDANLVRSPPPVAVRPSEPESSGPVGAELAGVPGPPTTMTSIPVAIPVQAQGYPNYFPENYAGYEQNYPPYNYYPYSYFAYAVPIGFRFPFGFFHRHDIHHGGFHVGAFRVGAFHGGGFRVGHR